MATVKKLMAVAKKIAALDAANESNEPLNIDYDDIVAMLLPGASDFMTVIGVISTRKKIPLYKGFLVMLTSLHRMQRELKAQLVNPRDIYREKALDLFEFELGLVALGLSGRLPITDAESSAPSLIKKGIMAEMYEFITKRQHKKDMAQRDEQDAEQELTMLLEDLKAFAREVLTNTSSMLNRFINLEYFRNDQARELVLPWSCFSNLLKYTDMFFGKRGGEDYKTFLGRLDELGRTFIDIQECDLVGPDFEEQFKQLFIDPPSVQQPLESL